VNRYPIAHEQETSRIAAALAPVLRGGCSIGLSGELGAGKTTFVRCLVTAAGGDPRAVASPTYTLQHEYPLPSGLTVEHWDLYRLTSLPLELEEAPGATVVRLIEWPERCPEVLAFLTCQMRFLHADDEDPNAGRILEITVDSGGEILSCLDALRGAHE
jgi:tRNA threonylcarbamoyl adenosine modification protein YjeE